MSERKPDLPPRLQRPADQPSEADLPGSYQKVADSVGMVPSLRGKDNLVQAIVALGFAVIGAFVGWLLWGAIGAAGLAIGGLILGTVLSGFVLMILGWKRVAKGSSGRER